MLERTDGPHGCCNHLPHIPRYVIVGVVITVALGVLSVVGYFALHWGRIPVASLGGSGGAALLIPLAIWAIRSVHVSSQSTKIHSSSKLTADIPVSQKPISNSSRDRTNSAIAIAIYNCVAKNNIDVFKELIKKHQKKLNEIIDMTVTDTQKLIHKSLIWELPLRLLFKKMEDSTFLSLLIEETKDIKSFAQYRAEFQAYELYKLMRDNKESEFNAKVEAYKKEMPQIMQNQVFTDDVDQDLYAKLDNAGKAANRPFASADLSITSAYYLLDIAIAKYETSPAYYNSLIGTLPSVTSSYCGKSTLLELLPEKEFEYLTRKMDAEFKKELIKKAILAGNVNWFKTLYSAKQLGDYLIDIKHAKSLDPQIRMELIKAIPIRELEAYKNIDDATVMHMMIDGANVQFLDKFVKYCADRCPNWYIKRDKYGRTPLVLVRSKKSPDNPLASEIEALLLKYTPTNDSSKLL